MCQGHTPTPRAPASLLGAQPAQPAGWHTPRIRAQRLTGSLCHLLTDKQRKTCNSPSEGEAEIEVHTV